MVNLVLPIQTQTSSVSANILTPDKTYKKGHFINIPNKSQDANNVYRVDCIECERSTHTIFHTQNSNKENKKPNLRRICSNITCKLGFNIDFRGTNFIIEAIMYLYENNIDRCKMEIVYKFLAQKYSISISNVKSSITNAINYLSDNIEPEIVSTFFSEYDGRKHPKPKYVIVHGVYELRKKYPPEGYDNERIRSILYTI